MFSDQFSEEGEDGKVGPSPRKLLKSGETAQMKFWTHDCDKLYSSQILCDPYVTIVFLMGYVVSRQTIR